MTKVDRIKYVSLWVSTALAILCLFFLLTGCHKPLTPGQKMLLTAPTSSRPVLHQRNTKPESESQ